MRFKVTAKLRSPCVTSSPLLLDGLLYYGVGRRMGLEVGGQVDPADVFSQPLPLEKIETEHGWWYAASQATPIGTEGKVYSHRRTSHSNLADWSTARAINRATGADKSLRNPVYYYWAWRKVVWTGVGDPVAVGTLLAHIPSIGARTTQGWGLVKSWEVVSGDGPALQEYATDINLRHLPVEAVLPSRSRVSRRNIPLNPPYHDRHRAQPCWQSRTG